MSNAASVMLWAARIHAKRGAPAHQLLDIKPTATVDEAQQAFHKIARMAHPDLHRNDLSADDLEILTAAYALVAGAYQTYRTQPQAAPAAQAGAREPTPPTGKPTARAPTAPPAPDSTAGIDPAEAMSAKALHYYRKAEVALKRGDHKAAILQIKLAIAADSTSGFLRTALAEAEAAKKNG